MRTKRFTGLVVAVSMLLVAAATLAQPRVAFDGKPAIIAAEVKKGDSTLVLRDSAGIPPWAGWRR